MRIIFMGTPQFAVPVLQELIDNKYNIVAVVTQVDKLANRNKLEISPVKKLALSHNLNVLQYNKISQEGVDELIAYKPDIMITAAYGQILSQRILDIAPILNVHASLLPKYRGASPIQAALLNNDKITGVTIMKTALSVDSGDILLKKSLDIYDNENSQELSSRLSKLGAQAIVEALDLIKKGMAVYTPQNEAEATYCKTIKKSDGLINFNKDYKSLNAFVNAMYPWPSAYAMLNGLPLKIISIEYVDKNNDDSIICGTVVSADKNGVIIKIMDSLIKLKLVQYAGGKVMEAFNLALGRKIMQGMVLNG